MKDKGSLKNLIENMPIPIILLGEDGKVECANSLIGDVFLYDSLEGTDFFQLTGIKYDSLLETLEEGNNLQLKRNEKNFELTIKQLEEIDRDNVLSIYFRDITDLVDATEKYEEDKPVVAVIEIDNYDEITSNKDEGIYIQLVSEIDRVIREWSTRVGGSITRYKDAMYLLVFDNKYLNKEKENKFPILEEVREIETHMDFPITLSIGIGLNGKNMGENDDFADQAIDLALGRGGDQVVIKDREKISYYGGNAATVEKRNKGKSRLIGQAVKRLIETSSKVLIMGHKNPDMDAFGAALGIYRLSELINKETYIVVESYTEALTSLIEEVQEIGDHNIINNKKAMSIVDDETLVVVVDTHRPSMTECPELLDACGKTIVVDHHRKGEEFITSPTISYAEPYASSTAELVTEMLQYTLDKKDILKIEAEGLMAGIFLDTNRFSAKTGVRTLEAAAWLRRAGADPSAVKRFFQVNREVLQTRSKSISDAEFDDKGIAYAICPGRSKHSQIINAQIADQLLTIRGINYSFVAGLNHEGNTTISARSIGENNVQKIMEHFGGGGHLNTAGAQVNDKPEEIIKQIKELMEEEFEDRNQEVDI